MTPNTHLAQQAGLVIANGIVTDTRMQTSQSDIYAIGDCACDGSAGPGLRIESVHNAASMPSGPAAASWAATSRAIRHPGSGPTSMM